MRNFTDKLAAEGIYVLVDFHQDVGSLYFCGEGLSTYTHPYEFKNTSIFPKPALDYAYQRDPVTHRVDHT